MPQFYLLLDLSRDAERDAASLPLLNTGSSHAAPVVSEAAVTDPLTLWMWLAQRVLVDELEAVKEHVTTDHVAVLQFLGNMTDHTITTAARTTAAGTT